MESNWYLYFVTALVPLLIGAIWYNPKVFGTAWLNSMGKTDEEMQQGKMWKIFLFTYLLGLLLSLFLNGLVNHQYAVYSLFATDPTFTEAGSEIQAYFANFMELYGDRHRSFGHGVLHGVLNGLIFFGTMFGILALFEKRSFKYVAIHVGYWVVSLGLMGGLLGQFL